MNLECLWKKTQIKKSIYQHSFGETTENIINDLLFTTDKVHHFEKEELKHLFTFAAFESFLIFEQEYYIQTDGIFMESSSGLTLANAFFCVC